MPWPPKDRIERDEPGEQRFVDGRRMRAGQRLVEMVVRVDEAGQDDMARGVEHGVDPLGRLAARHAGRNARSLDDEPARSAAGKDRQRVPDPCPHARPAPSDGPSWKGGQSVSTTRGMARTKADWPVAAFSATAWLVDVVDLHWTLQILLL